MFKDLNNNQGTALITAMIFMVILMLLGIWMVNQSVIGIKIAAALKRYEQAFNLADGACQMTMRYIIQHTPESSDWDPRKEANVAGLPAYIKETQTGNNKYRPEIIYKGYDPNPIPGWMLNWQGYSRFHRRHYKLKGQGETPRGNKATVSTLVVKILR